MRRIGLTAALILFGFTVSSAAAEALPLSPTVPATTQNSNRLRLHVYGSSAPRTTYWVSYGPLAGRFGILRLRPASAGTYQSAPVSLRGRTTLYFLQGNGVRRVHGQAVPGNPVITIKTIGPITLGSGPLPEVSWHAPLG